MIARIHSQLEKIEVCLEKMEATDLETNPEEIESSQSITKSLRKRPRWKLLEHWRTDVGTDI
jgi:hypothetical protein